MSVSTSIATPENPDNTTKSSNADQAELDNLTAYLIPGGIPRVNLALYTKSILLELSLFNAFNRLKINRLLILVAVAAYSLSLWRRQAQR
jgi:hypothetical protein